MSVRNRLRGLLLLCAVPAVVGCANPSLISIQITPATETFIGAAGHAQFTAIGTYKQGDHAATTQDITDVVTWESNAAAVATISPTGVASAAGALGSTQISASKQGYTGLIVGYAQVVVCMPSTTNPGQCAS